jgi:CheY-like chemotaxis protein
MAGSGILLIDGLGVSTAAVTERLRALGYPAIRAKTGNEALALLRETPTTQVVFLPSDLPAPDVAPVVTALRGAATGMSLVFACVGPRPGDEIRNAMRESGVAIALWEPFSDATLRFQTNRALGRPEGRRPRRATRVPCDVPVRAFGGGREKPCRLYTLSERGAFLETRRASMPGATLSLELEMASGMLEARGRVAMANVPGNVQNRRLPIGVAIEFTELDAAGQEVLRGRVEEISSFLDV